MVKKLIYALLVCSIGVACCALGEAVDESRPREADPFILAEQALENIFSVYKTYTRDAFTQNISRAFYPIRRNFIHAAENSFYSGAIIEMNYFIDEAIRKGDKLVVSFSWEKKTRPYNSAQISLTRGKARFVFKEESGKWLLCQMRGNNPF